MRKLIILIVRMIDLSSIKSKSFDVLRKATNFQTTCIFSSWGSNLYGNVNV